MIRITTLRLLLWLVTIAVVFGMACQQKPPDPADQEKMKAPVEEVDP